MTNYTCFDEKKLNYNPDTWKVIDTVEEFEREIDVFKNLKSSNEHILFRGICEANYKLYTSLQRDCFSKNINPAKVSQRDIVLRLLQEGRKNPKNHNILPAYFAKLGIPLNDWMLLAIMQHYGAPSPLLDFTKDFRPALYFMCAGMQHKFSSNPIDQYSSVVYFNAKNACGNVIESIRKTGLRIYQTTNPPLESYKERNNFVIEGLSFEKIMEGKILELIPSYKGVTNISHDNYRFIVNLPISNMNMASQEGEFVCNLSDNQPIESIMKKDGINYLSCINIHKSLYQYIITKYLNGSLEEMRRTLFPSEEQAAMDIYSRTLASLF